MCMLIQLLAFCYSHLYSLLWGKITPPSVEFLVNSELTSNLMGFSLTFFQIQSQKQQAEDFINNQIVQETENISIK